MIESKQIGWSAYADFEGPFFIGTSTFKMPDTPTFADKILAVITATEGGHWNAINMYDRCICTVGLIQWCEGGQYSVSDMLGKLQADHPNALRAIDHVREECGLIFKKNGKGRWRFHFTDARGEVDRTEEQQQMFFGSASGKKGSWSDGSRELAKRWAAALASLYELPEAIESQREYTVPRLYGFSLTTANQLFLHRESKETPIGQAFTCAYLSFAANNPARADASLKDALATWDGTKGPIWSPRWFNHVLERLTFASGVTIYPARYNAIRPVLERLFGIDIPDRSEQLQGLLSAAEIQDILVHKLQYDLGKSGPKGDGVDGAWGTKSKTALMDFERRNGLVSDGLPDKLTNDALLRIRDAA
jgi:putative peptidoglycan binding protein